MMMVEWKSSNGIQLLMNYLSVLHQFHVLNNKLVPFREFDSAPYIYSANGNLISDKDYNQMEEAGYVPLEFKLVLGLDEKVINEYDIVFFMSKNRLDLFEKIKHIQDKYNRLREYMTISFKQVKYETLNNN